MVHVASTGKLQRVVGHGGVGPRRVRVLSSAAMANRSLEVPGTVWTGPRTAQGGQSRLPEKRHGQNGPNYQSDRQHMIWRRRAGHAHLQSIKQLLRRLPAPWPLTQPPGTSSPADRPGTLVPRPRDARRAHAASQGASPAARPKPASIVPGLRKTWRPDAPVRQGSPVSECEIVLTTLVGVPAIA